MADSTKTILKAAKSGDVATLHSLLASDKQLLLVRDKDGSTLLHCAAWKGHLPAVSLLLAAGADVSATNQNDHWGNTPLHAAAHANQAAIAELLIAHGAQVNAADGQGNTPLDHTDFHKATAAAKVLLAHGACRQCRE